MAKFIITEKQMDFIRRNLLSEAVGVPEGIIESAQKLYDTILGIVKRMNNDESQNFNEDIDLTISDVHIDELDVNIRVDVNEDYLGDITVTRFGVVTDFYFDENILLKVIKDTKTIEMVLDFISKDDQWSPNDIYNILINNKEHMISIFAHELKHKFDKQKKQKDLISRDVEYFAVANSGLNFGIPVIQDFLRASYFIHIAENLVRPTEVATRMKLKNIKKEEFLDFLRNDAVFKELVEIKNFSYEYLVDRLKKEIKYVDKFLNFVDYRGYETLSDDEKIIIVLRLVYVNLANTKIESFDKITDNTPKDFEGFLKFFKTRGVRTEEFEKFRSKYLNKVVKYENREVDFFKDECERFNYVATKLIKKISKVYSLIDDKETTNESIINWELHQRLVEKEHGRRKIDTDYKYKRK